MNSNCYNKSKLSNDTKQNLELKHSYTTQTIHDYYNLFLNEKMCQSATPSQVNWYINLVGKVRKNEPNEIEQNLLNQLSKGGKVAEIAKRKLFNMHLGTVILIAKKLCSKIRKSKLEDVIQEGNIGLLNAIRIYNPKFNGDFVHFATIHIVQSIADKYKTHHFL